MPPRIEKWVMEMQDVTYELVYEPGKDEAEPLDYLSRHPLPETGSDSTENIVKWNTNAEHAVVITRIREETRKDPVMQRLAQRIVNGDWEKHKRDKDLEPYIHVKHELSVAEGLIFREQRIIFGGPYPDGHYNLVLIDKRTRYPVVETTPSTSFPPIKERLKHTFAIYGTPRRVESDNGPPFNSKEGFKHHRITHLHPKANGEVERFMQTLNKTEEIASLQGKDRLERQNAVQDMLIAYRSTPHPATGVSPYEAMRGAVVSIKLDHVEPHTEI